MGKPHLGGGDKTLLRTTNLKYMCRMIRVRVFLGSDGGWFLGFLAKVGGLGKMMEATIFFLLVVCV